MSAQLAFSFTYYIRTYQRYAIDFWENITPMQYGCLLLSVMAIGYLLMKSTGKR